MRPFFADKEKKPRRQFQQTNSITLLTIRWGAETMILSLTGLVNCETDPDHENHKRQLARYAHLHASVLYELAERRVFSKDDVLLYQNCLRYDKKHFPDDDLGIDEPTDQAAE